MEMLRVEWWDAVASNGWESADDTKANVSLHKIETVGFLVHEDDDCLVLAGSRSWDDDETNNRMAIPKRWIINRETLRT